jgi:hypothetical protein
LAIREGGRDITGSRSVNPADRDLGSWPVFQIQYGVQREMYFKKLLSVLTLPTHRTLTWLIRQLCIRVEIACVNPGNDWVGALNVSNVLQVLKGSAGSRLQLNIKSTEEHLLNWQSNVSLGDIVVLSHVMVLSS